MLSLRSIEIQGFGPFADKQVIEFPDDGVVVIYGENMRGKTSLLNAIRYAFFGTVLGRDSRERGVHAISNRDMAAQGKFGFSVVLRFTHGGLNYELERACVPRSGVARPERDEDYQQDVYLLREDQPLGPDERKRALAHVFPDQIARFFLFDGELLQEYQALLYQGDTGRRISQAIERILGLPILTSARTHLGVLRQQAEEAAGLEASRSRETEQTGNALSNTLALRTAQNEELARLRQRLRELRGKQVEAEEYLRTNARFDAILDERDRCQAELREVDEGLTTAEATLKTTMKDAWRTVLAPQVRTARAAVQARASADLDSLVASLRRRALERGTCGTCERDLDPDTRARLQGRLDANPGEGAAAGVRAELVNLASLNSFQDRDVSGSVAQISKSIRESKVRQKHLFDKLKDLKTELGDADVDRLRSSGTSIGDVARKIAADEEAVTKTEKKLADLDNNIGRFTAKLEGLGTADLRTTRLRSSLLRDAADVFSAAVEHYKSQLRRRVEVSATELFLCMTTEKEEYAGLAINDGYGLEILHREGGAEVGRSAGAEHVVALALMGALQKNAPLSGPIVMDSPFGRLDPGHTTNVVATLPKLAPQVALLVHGKEVTREQLRRLLGGSLKREYELVKVSSRRTQITLVE